MDNIAYIIPTIIILLVSLGIHEFAHAKIADSAGDPTPRMNGRVTLNILKHLDPVGTMMIFITVFAGFGIGWGKPVPMDPQKMKNPRWDFFAAVAAGPISNFLQATFFALIIRYLISSNMLLNYEYLANILMIGVSINLSLCFFNLLPIGPLDGAHLFGTFLSERYRYFWYRWNMQYGSLILLGMVLLGQTSGFSIIGKVLWPAVKTTSRFLIGW